MSLQMVVPPTGLWAFLRGQRGVQWLAWAAGLLELADRGSWVLSAFVAPPGLCVCGLGALVVMAWRGADVEGA